MHCMSEVLPSGPDQGNVAQSRDRELALKEREVLLQQRRLDWEMRESTFLRSPGGGAIAALIAALLALIGIYLQVSAQRSQDVARAKDQATIERDRLNVQIILKAYDISPSTVDGAARVQLAARNVLWFQRAGLLNLQAKTVRQLEIAADVKEGADITALYIQPGGWGDYPYSNIDWRDQGLVGSHILQLPAGGLRVSIPKLDPFVAKYEGQTVTISTVAVLWPADEASATKLGFLPDKFPDELKVALIEGEEIEDFIPAKIETAEITLHGPDRRVIRVTISKQRLKIDPDSAASQPIIVCSKAVYELLKGDQQPGLRVSFRLPSKNK